MIKMVLWQAPVSQKKWGEKIGQKKGTPDAELVIDTTDGVICAPWGNLVAQLTLGMMQQRVHPCDDTCVMNPWEML